MNQYIRIHYVNPTGLILKWPLYQYIPTSNYWASHRMTNWWLWHGNDLIIAPGPRHSSLWLRAKSRKSTATMPSTHSRDTCVRFKRIWLSGVTKMEGQAQQTKTWQKKINKNMKKTHPHWIKSFVFSISVCMSYCIPLAAHQHLTSTTPLQSIHTSLLQE